MRLQNYVGKQKKKIQRKFEDSPKTNRFGARFLHYYGIWINGDEAREPNYEEQDHEKT